MKTIRHNTFETNSSSTHSITVCKGPYAEPRNYFKPVVDERNYLVPGN